MSDLVAGLAESDGGWSVDLPPDWMQGRTAYGGVAAALTVEVGRRLLAPTPLRAAEFAFIAPSSGRVALVPTILRRGRSVTFIAVDLTSGGALATRALLCFGAPRPTLLGGLAPAPPEAPRPDACDSLAGPGTPAYWAQFDIRPVGPGRVGGGGHRAELAAWCRHRDAAGVDETVALVALGDVSAPAPLAMLDQLVPVSTMTWSVEVGPDPGRGGAGGWRYVEVVADMMADGYAAERITVRSEDGAPLLTARQSVAIFG